MTTSELRTQFASQLSVEQTEGQDDKPSPLDFVTFLPWACRQLSLKTDVVIKRVAPSVEVNIRTGKSRVFKPSAENLSEQQAHQQNFDDYGDEHGNVKIAVMYQNENIERLIFDKNKEVPQSILKLIRLIIKYHPFLQVIIINKGLNMYSIYELSKTLEVSNITELRLDGNFVPEGNYDILLQNAAKLKLLSIARCNINDKVIKKIAERLTYPAPAYKTLMILNLSSNRITDVGAEYLGYSLGRNIKLCYLNLSGNMITEKGGNCILDSMLQFPLTCDEIIEARSQHQTYILSRQEMINRIAHDLKFLDQDKKKDTKKKTVKGKPAPSNEPEPSEKTGENGDLEASFYEKARVIAESHVEEFYHPFSEHHTVKEKDYVYAIGNNTLTYLNMAYNNLSYTFVKKLLHVLQYQKKFLRKPKGLEKVNIEGIPVAGCYELQIIDNMLFENFNNLESRPTLMKRRNSLRQKV